jgi:hypothetical protein
MAVENVTVNFEDGTSRAFGNCAWRWTDGVLTIMEFVNDPEFGKRSVPTFQAPYEAVQCIDIEYAEKVE